MSTTKNIGLIALLLVFTALGLAGTMDAQDAENSRRGYCEMVALWDKDAELGIAPEKRNGWPPYDGRKQCNY
jgi:hypothetical protein